MNTEPDRAIDPLLYPAGTGLEPGASAISWSAIFGGTLVAIALSLVLLALGGGFGLAGASQWPGVGQAAAAFSLSAGIWLIVMQWLSSAFGGYLAGRMRLRWHGLHSHETYFRDTVHGLLTWAMATILVTLVAVVATVFAVTELPTVANAATVTAEIAEESRDASSLASIFTAISMLVGAFIASVAAVIGGQQRDRHP